MHPLVERRKRLAERLPDTPVLLMNGTERPRNYPGNPYPFRGDSHFIYFCGLQPPGSAALLSGGEGHLFLEPVTVDDAIWSGPGPDWDEVAAATGCTVHPRGHLERFLDMAGKPRVASLPTQDPRTREELGTLLGRVPDPGGSGLDGDLARAMVDLRLYQDEAALAEIREACRVTVDAHLAGLRATRVGGDTRQVLADMQAACTREGMTCSFQPIVTPCGERLHRPFEAEALEDGALLLADFGAEAASGFAGDVTNTWPVSGRFSPRQRDAYEAVLEAHRRSARLVAPGVRYRDVHLEACRALAEALVEMGLLEGRPDDLVDRDAHALFFPHGVGHLMGLDVHDMEDLGDLAGYAPGRERSSRFGLKWLRLDRDLEPGMVLTIEPGFYWIPEVLGDQERREAFADCVRWEKVEEFREVRGIRIERDFLVTPGGSELLTPGLPDTAEEIEAAVGIAVRA